MSWVLRAQWQQNDEKKEPHFPFQHEQPLLNAHTFNCDWFLEHLKKHEKLIILIYGGFAGLINAPPKSINRINSWKIFHSSTMCSPFGSDCAIQSIEKVDGLFLYFSTEFNHYNMLKTEWNKFFFFTFLFNLSSTEAQFSHQPKQTTLVFGWWTKKNGASEVLWKFQRIMKKKTTTHTCTHAHSERERGPNNFLTKSELAFEKAWRIVGRFVWIIKQWHEQNILIEDQIWHQHEWNLSKFNMFVTYLLSHAVRIGVCRKHEKIS